MAGIPQAEIDQAVNELIEFTATLDGGFANPDNREQIGSFAEGRGRRFASRYDNEVPGRASGNGISFFTDQEFELAMASDFDDMALGSGAALINLAQAKLAESA